MTAYRVRRVVAGFAVAAAVLGGTAACAAESEIDVIMNCLDDAGVTYSVEDGAVVVDQYAEEDSDRTSKAARACLDLIDGS
ncbi:hypothetical protein BJQ94_04845 [Cryobacterium sp. SO2]|uniref:hypothetical protein n=1 Tax=Cryobacterium sp. SO2 TaxID=1897060 RepID=UPI00223E77FF|nr:hypothetical protein [Cryobacterium sp. SO2]WEO78369.1 hypothetical protein BJQ94_04845 [Cryobacterium sp. SO2]